MAAATEVDRDQIVRLRTVLLRSNRRLRKRGDSGLSASQLSAMSIIHRRGSVRPGDLSRVEQVSKSTVTRLLAGLEALGLVTRAPNADDGRSAVVKLTEEGGRLLEESSLRIDDYLAEQIAVMSKADSDLVVAAIPVLERLFAPGA